LKKRVGEFAAELKRVKKTRCRNRGLSDPAMIGGNYRVGQADVVDAARESIATLISH
jgi:hypothetical protein